MRREEIFLLLLGFCACFFGGRIARAGESCIGPRLPLEVALRIPKVPFELAQRWLKEPATEPFMKLEIGAGHLPICDDCVQVDRYRDTLDFLKTEAREHGIPEEMIALRHNHTFAVAEPGRVGVIADAQHLPFKDNSASFMVAKHLPWATPHSNSKQLRFIERVLGEAQRVLKPEGRFFVLVNGYHDPAIELAAHAKVAQELGFRVLETRGSEWSGWILEKVATR